MECYDIHLLDRADSAAEYDIQSVVQIDADVAKSSISVDLHYRIECQASLCSKNVFILPKALSNHEEKSVSYR